MILDALETADRPREDPAKELAQLRKNNEPFLPLMCGKGNCYDNAMLETVFKTTKNELIWRTNFQTRRGAELTFGRDMEANDRRAEYLDQIRG